MRKLKAIHPECEVILYFYTPTPQRDPERARRDGPGVRAFRTAYGAQEVDLPATPEEWTEKRWVDFVCHQDAPWLTPRLRRRIRDFATVLACRFPTVQDARTADWGKAVLRGLASWRWSTETYARPLELEMARQPHPAEASAERGVVTPAVPPFTPDGLIGIPLPPGAEPERVVVVRFHAFGDTAITFPLLAALRKRFPSVRLDVVTDVRSEALFRAHRDVDGVFAFDTRRGRFRKGASLLVLALSARRRAVPTVLDLQRNRWSAFLIRLLSPGTWVGFDRHAPRTALSRYLEAAEGLGLGRLAPVFAPHAREPLLLEARQRLLAQGWDGEAPLVCLNPAGGWETKQWAIERYVELGRRLHAEGCRLVALSTSPAPPRFAALKDGLGSRLLDLTGRTVPEEALALVACFALVVSDDSGLMHLAWTQGVATLALFGASRSAWSRPEGPGSDGFYSEDLECGACLSPVCARSDVLCLARVGVDDVIAKARALLALGAGTGRP